MPPLFHNVEFCRLYPNRPKYLFLAVFAFSSPFCYAKTAFSYSRTLLSPCTPVLFMVKYVVKSVSEKTICGHHFEAKKQLENSSSVRVATHQEQRRNTPTTTCGLIDKQQRQLCGQAQIKSHGQTMWSEQKITHRSFLSRCCIVTLLQAVVKAP